MTQRSILLAAVALSAALGLAGCVGNPAPPSMHSDPLPPAVAIAGELVGQGTVLQIRDAPPEFCLGPVAESYPPQCGGPELVGWDWDAVQGHETASDVTWGTYAVWGDWDGARFTVASAIMLALYDPIPIEEPYLDPANRGDTPEAELIAIQDRLASEAGFELLASVPQNGYLFVDVLVDDGTLQRLVDERYGPEVVIIRPALRPVG
jgi:hypothetical protein